MRETSLVTFRQIKENGLLSEMRFKVYECVFNHGPMTSKEVFSRLMLETNQSGRFSELRDAGVLKEVGTMLSGATKRPAILWDVTWDLPQKVTRKSRRAEIKLILSDLKSNLFLADEDSKKIERVQELVNEIR